MPAKQDAFLKLRNFREVQHILQDVAEGRDLSWIESVAASVGGRWFRLAQQHFRIAKQLSGSPRNWRSTVSRCYYAVYNGSKCVRFLVTGGVDLTADDHKRVGDLPADFPDRTYWSSFAVDMRRDRNLADYEPWTHVRRTLFREPQSAVAATGEFLQTCRDYLRKRGFAL